MNDGCGACGACATACRLDAIETPAEPGRTPAAATCRRAGRGGRRRGSAPRPRRHLRVHHVSGLPRRLPQGGRHELRAPARPDRGRTTTPAAARWSWRRRAGVGAVLLFGAGAARAVKRPGLIRPPGAQDESAFLSRCLRCSECMKACPTSGLQPTLAEAGLEGLWTPVLRLAPGLLRLRLQRLRPGLPLGRDPAAPLARKREQVLGLAVIDRDRCLPWAKATPCIVCQEMCPVPEKAIVLEPEQRRHPRRRRRGPLARPKVVASRCIGCGICEFKCPVEGRRRSWSSLRPRVARQPTPLGKSAGEAILRRHEHQTTAPWPTSAPPACSGASTTTSSSVSRASPSRAAWRRTRPCSSRGTRRTPSTCSPRAA